MENTTVYVLTYGDYEDTHTVGIFTTREKAERQILDHVFGNVRIESPRIIEHELI